MDNQKLVMAREELQAKLQDIAINPVGMVTEFAKLANLPYDAELPIPEVISEIAKTDSVAKGEDYYYFAISPDGKVVTTISNGSLTQTNVTPGSENELTFASYSSEEYYVYLEKLLEAKYDVVAQKTGDAMESLNRKEVKDVLDALLAAAVTRSNTFCLDSGDSELNFKKLVEMVRSLAKYGNKLVLVSGANVTTDIRLMDYTENKQREVTLEKAGISKWIPLEELTYDHAGTQKVLDKDYAILVATSDAAQNRCIHFVRRMVNSIDGAGQKERIIWVQPTRIQVGSNPKWAYSVAAMEQYGVVVANTYVVAAFHRASSY
jgi:histidinol phosphatase-like PHP family hydrolase